MNPAEKEWRMVAYSIPAAIRQFLETTFLIYEIRKQVCQKKGVKFIVYTNEKNHARAHVHAEYGEYSISISIDDDPVVLAGELPKTQERFAINWVKANKEKLLNDWKTIAVSAISQSTDTRLNGNW